MNNTDLVSAIAKLLSDPVARRRFREDAEALAREWGVPASDVDAFAKLDPDEIERQANGLLNKRWHEVQQQIPETVQSLGGEAAGLFRFYATHHWVEGHRRHKRDAQEFLRFLKANKIRLN